MDLSERLRRVPGVAAAGAGFSLPLSGSNVGTSAMAEGRPLPAAERPTVGWQMVTPGYFAAAGIPLRRGRDFAAADVGRQAHQVVVNEAMARALFDAEDPIGRRVLLGGGEGDPDWHEVIGVVGNVRHASLTAPPAPRAYDLLGQHWERTLFVVVRGTGDPEALAPVLRRELAALDATAPVFDVRALDELVGRASAERRASAIFSSGVGAVSLLLAAIGIYGLLAGAVAARTREIGVRRALGASTSAVVALVGREAIVMTAAGIAAGLAAALAAGRLIDAYLFGVRATDPASIAGVSALLAATAAMASVAPARRAARVDPAIALRTE
jgi:predicted permease